MKKKIATMVVGIILLFKPVSVQAYEVNLQDSKIICRNHSFIKDKKNIIEKDNEKEELNINFDSDIEKLMKQDSFEDPIMNIATVLLIMLIIFEVIILFNVKISGKKIER